MLPKKWSSPELFTVVSNNSDNNNDNITPLQSAAAPPPLFNFSKNPEFTSSLNRASSFSNVTSSTSTRSSSTHHNHYSTVNDMSLLSMCDPEIDTFVDDCELEDNDNTDNNIDFVRSQLKAPLKRATSCPALKKKNPNTSLCKYRGGRCLQPCAVKIDGSLHSLCELHRKRQNDNQKRSDARRRAEITHRRRTRRLGFKRNVLEPFPFQKKESSSSSLVSCSSSPSIITPPVRTSISGDSNSQEMLDFLRQSNFGESYNNNNNNTVEDDEDVVQIIVGGDDGDNQRLEINNNNIDSSSSKKSVFSQ